jgi:hypothetical protein
MGSGKSAKRRQLCTKVPPVPDTRHLHARHLRVRAWLLTQAGQFRRSLAEIKDAKNAATNSLPEPSSFEVHFAVETEGGRLVESFYMCHFCRTYGPLSLFTANKVELCVYHDYALQKDRGACSTREGGAASGHAGASPTSRSAAGGAASGHAGSSPTSRSAAEGNGAAAHLPHSRKASVYPLVPGAHCGSTNLLGGPPDAFRETPTSSTSVPSYADQNAHHFYAPAQPLVDPRPDRHFGEVRNSVPDAWSRQRGDDLGFAAAEAGDDALDFIRSEQELQ